MDTWVYDDDSFDDENWTSMLERELGHMWSFDLSANDICYKVRTANICSRDVNVYCVIAVNYVMSANPYVLHYNLASVIRYVYEFEHPDNPVYIEEGLDYRRRDARLSFGRFKTIDDAITHAEKRLPRLEDKYYISEENKGKFPIPVERFDDYEKVFDAYVPHVIDTRMYDGLQVDELEMFNTMEDKIEEFYAIRIPFIRVGGRKKRKLFGVKDVLEERKESGMSLYVKRDDVNSFSYFMERLRQEFMTIYMYEVIATESEFGDQDIPDIMYPDEDEFKYS